MEVDHSVGTCPLTDAVKGTKDEDLFELLTNEQQRDMAIKRWMVGFPWKPDHAAMQRKCLSEEVHVPTVEALDDHVLHLQNCIAYHHCIDDLVQHYIGRHLSRLLEMTPSTTQNQLLKELCNIAKASKVAMYQEQLATCTMTRCRECLAAQEWESGDHTVAETRPCLTTQIVCKLGEKRFLNLTPGFMQQWISTSRKVSVHS